MFFYRDAYLTCTKIWEHAQPAVGNEFCQSVKYWVDKNTTMCVNIQLQNGDDLYIVLDLIEIHI